MGILKEYLISTNEYNLPKEVLGKKAVGVLMVRLLLLEPGTDPMRPEMGVGIVSKYRYMFPDNLADLKKDICDQLARYLYPYQRINIVMEVKNKELLMDIMIDDTTYKYVIAEQEDNTVTLQELQESVNDTIF